MSKHKRGRRYQVAEPTRHSDLPTAAKIGLIWLVLDTHSGDDPYPVVATEVTRAKARATAKRLNNDQEHPVP